MMANWSAEKDLNIIFDGTATYFQQFRDGLNLKKLKEDLAKDGIEIEIENFFCG